MPDKQLIYHIKHEMNSDMLYLVAVTCIERLVEKRKPGVIKAIIDVGTSTLLKMNKT